MLRGGGGGAWGDDDDDNDDDDSVSYVLCISCALHGVQIEAKETTRKERAMPRPASHSMTVAVSGTARSSAVLEGEGGPTLLLLGCILTPDRVG